MSKKPNDKNKAQAKGKDAKKKNDKEDEEFEIE